MPPADLTTGSACCSGRFSALEDQRAEILPVQRSPTLVVGAHCMMNDGKLDFQFIEYVGALHAFSNPDADKAHAASLDGVGYNAEAATRSWNQMKIFFGEIFGQ
jgi:dienelactone hydrolase